MKRCFIVCPIGENGSETRQRSDKLLKHILNPICSQCGFETIRVDNLNLPDSIDQTIIDNLKNADLVIADLTEHNPNAFYEIGYRTALGKPIIHLKDKNYSIPFDVSTIRTFDYDLADLDSVNEIKERLLQTIKSIDFNSISDNSLDIDITPIAETFNSQILQELFKIQDGIKELSIEISTNNNSAVSLLADKLANTNSKSDQAVMMETLIPTLLSDPSKLNALIDITNKMNNLK